MSSKVWVLDHEDLFMSLPLHTTKINFHPDCREFGITVTLKPHQVEGVSSLIYKYLLSVNVLLGYVVPPLFFRNAIFVIVSMLSLIYRLSRWVVLCPLSVTDGWVEETKGSLQNMKFLGMLVIKIAIGIFESLLLFNVLFTTYAIALMDQDFLSQIRWQYAVIDEAQILKNPNSVVSLGIFIEF
ncbi:hypothetical protein IGI04_002257 [Brassica rapa subsp. trilocularis]|uniref:SNF2 N-terminal domain-containing protein n=1 Tax=Brassica rapa subsp. trilocularis TaxID=1813537 RepID=A0ABQ7NV01_BRACM|nr:hypothetical protein IGI04_002257 [Brassica rapa subsp. trilocularis]